MEVSQCGQVFGTSVTQDSRKSAKVHLRRCAYLLPPSDDYTVSQTCITVCCTIVLHLHKERVLFDNNAILRPTILRFSTTSRHFLPRTSPDFRILLYVHSVRSQLAVDTSYLGRMRKLDIRDIWMPCVSERPRTPSKISRDPHRNSIFDHYTFSEPAPNSKREYLIKI